MDGSYFACAEDSEHLLHCWGNEAIARETPTVPVSQWSIEINGGCAVVESGAVTCWGDYEEVWAQAAPAPTGPPEGIKFQAVSVGRLHACALDQDGEVHCWGITGFGEPFPQAPPGPFVALESWHAVTCALRQDGSAACWHHLPGLLDTWSIPDERWAQLGLGEWDGCGLTLDGRAVCFGVSYNAGVWTVPSLDDLED